MSLFSFLAQATSIFSIAAVAIFTIMNNGPDSDSDRNRTNNPLWDDESVLDFNLQAVRDQYDEYIMTMDQGEVFNFKIEEKPSTAFIWLVDYTDSCVNEILNLEKTFSPPPEGVNGASG